MHAETRSAFPAGLRAAYIRCGSDWWGGGCVSGALCGLIASRLRPCPGAGRRPLHHLRLALCTTSRGTKPGQMPFLLTSTGARAGKVVQGPRRTPAGGRTGAGRGDKSGQIVGLAGWPALSALMASRGTRDRRARIDAIELSGRAGKRRIRCGSDWRGERCFPPALVAAVGLPGCRPSARVPALGPGAGPRVGSVGGIGNVARAASGDWFQGERVGGDGAGQVR